MSIPGLKSSQKLQLRMRSLSTEIYHRIENAVSFVRRPTEFKTSDDVVAWQLEKLIWSHASRCAYIRSGDFDVVLMKIDISQGKCKCRSPRFLLNHIELAYI